MNPLAVAFVLLNFAAVGLLPMLFFRRDGRLNGRWWLTAAPFFAAPALVAAAAAGLLRPIVAAPGSGLLAVPFALGSIALIGFAIRAHRVRIALWHQGGDADAPSQLVTWGPYRRVRHPFYTAFLLALTAAVVLCPHPALAGVWIYGLVALSVTAAREERRLSCSAFGAAYQAYVKTTGRFIPRWLLLPLLLSVCLTAPARSANAQQPKPARFWTVTGAHVAAGVAMYRHAQATWGASNGRLHVKHDWSADGLLQNDEISHFMFGYHLTRTLAGAWAWTGIAPRKARTIAAIETAAILTLVELPLDGFNPEQGFGVEDLAFDYLGVAVGLAQLRHPGRWDFRFSAKRNPLTSRSSFFAGDQRESDNYVFWATYRPAFGSVERQPFSVGVGHSARRTGSGGAVRELYAGVGTSVPDLVRAVAPRAARHVEVLGAYFLNLNVRATLK